jgi:hypothetical protein
MNDDIPALPETTLAEPLRRALGAIGRVRGLALGLGGLGMAIAALFAATLGSAIVTGAMAGPLAGLGTGLGAALGVFLAGAGALCLLGWGVGLALQARGRSLSS